MSSTDPMFDESDLQVEDYYCKHGTFIGNPYGADYTCMHCEMGVTDSDYIIGLKCEKVHKYISQMRNKFFTAIFHGIYLSEIWEQPEMAEYCRELGNFYQALEKSAYDGIGAFPLEIHALNNR